MFNYSNVNQFTGRFKCSLWLSSLQVSSIVLMLTSLQIGSSVLMLTSLKVGSSVLLFTSLQIKFKT